MQKKKFNKLHGINFCDRKIFIFILIQTNNQGNVISFCQVNASNYISY